MREESKTTETYEEHLRRHPVTRVMAVIGVCVIVALIILVIVTGVTGSGYFLPSLALLIVVPVLFYAVIWIGRVLFQHKKNRT